VDDEKDKLRFAILKGNIPDFNRLYLSERVEREEDPARRDILAALLEGYDTGQVKMSFDPFTQEMMYTAAEIN
jgi:hypothetical protein